MEKKKRRFKISGTLIFNIAVIAISVFLIIHFIVSENGLIDLLSKPDSFNIFWIIIAFLAYDFNIFIDSIVTLIYIRSQYPDFRYIDAVKVAFVGVFFGAVTPSNTGGQPMQLYLLSKMKVGVGFGSACMTQKFIVYQIVTTAFSIFAVIYKFDFFKSAFTGFWATAFIILGFTVQLVVTALFLIVSFSRKVTAKLIKLIYKIIKMIRFIKEPEKKVEKLYTEFEMFHKANTELMSNKKRLAAIYGLVLVQVMAIFSVPYFIYISFGMPKIAVEHHLPTANLFEFICIQSFVLFTSNLVPLPGASGGAELAFSMYFGRFFVMGGVDKIKPAILLWRFVSYYGAMLLTAPFSYYTKGRKKELAQRSSQESENTE